MRFSLCLSIGPFVDLSAFPPKHAWSIGHLCLTICDPMDCSPPVSSVHGILQTRILEWVAISSSRRPS